MEVNKEKHFNFKSVLVLFQNCFILPWILKHNEMILKQIFKLKCLPLIISVSLLVFLCFPSVSLFHFFKPFIGSYFFDKTIFTSVLLLLQLLFWFT